MRKAKKKSIISWFDSYLPPKVPPILFFDCVEHSLTLQSTQSFYLIFEDELKKVLKLRY